MCFRQVVVFLAGLPKPNTPETAGCQGDLTRIRLVTGGPVTYAGSTKHTLDTVLTHDNRKNCEYQCEPHQYPHGAVTGTRQPQHSHKDDTVDDSGTQVSAQHDSAHQRQKAKKRGEKSSPTVLRNVPLPSQHEGHPQNKNRFRQFRRLKLHRAKHNPVTVTANLNAHHKHRNLQQDTQHHGRVQHPPAPIPPHRQEPHHQHEGKTPDGVLQLSFPLVKRGHTLRNHAHRRSGQHHNAPEERQAHTHQQDQAGHI